MTALNIEAHQWNFSHLCEIYTCIKYLAISIRIFRFVFKFTDVNLNNRLSS